MDGTKGTTIDLYAETAYAMYEHIHISTHMVDDLKGTIMDLYAETAYATLYLHTYRYM